MSATPNRFTPTQLRTLAVIYGKQENGLSLPTTADIAADLGTAPEGVGQTTGSLVRRGCLTREKRAGRVTFRLTVRGEAIARPAYHQLEGNDL